MQNLEVLTDEQLVAMYAEGNNNAFDVLLARHKDHVYTCITQKVHDEELANDLFQETFVKAITTIKQGKYTESGKFQAWLCCVARNLIVDHFRHAKTENAVSIDAADYDILNRRDLADSTVEDQMISTQLTRDLRALVNELPWNLKQVLVMRYYKNLSFKEIAELTGVSINTALGRMRYALLNLRRMASERNGVLEF